MHGLIILIVLDVSISGDFRSLVKTEFAVAGSN